MQVHINRKTYFFPEESLSISQILAQLNYTFPNIYVKISDQIIDQKEFDQVLLKDQDEVAIIHFCCGG